MIGMTFLIGRRFAGDRFDRSCLHLHLSIKPPTFVELLPTLGLQIPFPICVCPRKRAPKVTVVTSEISRVQFIQPKLQGSIRILSSMEVKHRSISNYLISMAAMEVRAALSGEILAVLTEVEGKSVMTLKQSLAERGLESRDSGSDSYRKMVPGGFRKRRHSTLE